MGDQVGGKVRRTAALVALLVVSIVGLGLWMTPGASALPPGLGDPPLPPPIDIDPPVTPPPDLIDPPTTTEPPPPTTVPPPPTTVAPPPDEPPPPLPDDPPPDPGEPPATTVPPTEDPADPAQSARDGDIVLTAGGEAVGPTATGVAATQERRERRDRQRDQADREDRRTEVAGRASERALDDLQPAAARAAAEASRSFFNRTLGGLSLIQLLALLAIVLWAGWRLSLRV